MLIESIKSMLYKKLVKCIIGAWGITTFIGKISLKISKVIFERGLRVCCLMYIDNGRTIKISNNCGTSNASFC